MNYQIYNNYYYHKSKAIWWLHRRVDNEYVKKTGTLGRAESAFEDGKRTYASKTIQRIVEDLK